MNKSVYLMTLCLLLTACDTILDRKRANIIRTGTLSEIRTNEAFVDGLLLDVSDRKDEDIVAFGHAWGLNENPTILDSTTNFKEGKSPTTFRSLLPNLQAETTYHVRAYLTTNENTIYGENIRFIPGQVTTISVVDIGVDQAAAEGLLSESATNVQRFGHCWATANLPTLEDNTANGMPEIEGGYFSALTNLQPGTRYYVRAFMVNTNGFISYGKEIIFETDI